MPIKIAQLQKGLPRDGDYGKKIFLHFVEMTSRDMGASAYLKYILFGVLLLLLGLSVAAYWNQREHIKEIQWVRHSNRVLRHLESLFSTVKDAETGQRGYQLTHDSTFLEPYFQSVQSLDSDIDLLDSLFLDARRQKVRKDSLKILIARQYSLIKRILLHESQSEQEVDGYKLKLLTLSKENMDKVRKKVAEMEDTEEVILKERLSNVEGSERIAPITLLVYAILALAVVSVLFILLSNELARRKSVEDDLRLYTTDLKRSNEDLEQFAYVASHDLQEPLRKIRAFGDRLQTSYSERLDEKGKDYIQRMQNAAKRMQILIDDLLSFSRISRGISEHEDVDLNIVAEELAEDMETLIEQTHATIESSSLPTVSGDSGQLKRLFQNILSNAIKFRHPERKPRIQIHSLKVRREDINQTGLPSKYQHFYRISIKDNGIGFNEKYAEKIFIIFQRLHGRSEYHGTGIGLAVCRKIANNHNGFITVKSVEGEGSEFCIYLPENNVS